MSGEALLERMEGSGLWGKQMRACSKRTGSLLLANLPKAEGSMKRNVIGSMRPNSFLVPFQLAFEVFGTHVDGFFKSVAILTRDEFVTRDV